MLRDQIAVGLVDSRRLLRDALRLLISRDDGSRPEPVVVHETGNAHEMLEWLGDGRAAVVLAAVELIGMDGIELVRRLARRRPPVRVVLYGMRDSAPMIERGIRAGAWGFLSADVPLATVREAIRAVAAGRRAYHTSLPTEVVWGYHYAARADEPPETALTPRQQEVLRYVCEGCTERQIAEILGISPHTVHVHKNNIMRGLQVHSSVELVRYAVHCGLVVA